MRTLIVRTETLPYAIVRECGNLSVIDLGSHPTSIRDSEFKGTAIEEIDIPKSVTSVDVWAFADCRNLKRVTFHGETALHLVPFPACGIETFVIEEGAKITSDDRNPFESDKHYCFVPCCDIFEERGNSWHIGNQSDRYDDRNSLEKYVLS